MRFLSEQLSAQRRGRLRRDLPELRADVLDGGPLLHAPLVHRDPVLLELDHPATIVTREKKANRLGPEIEPEDCRAGSPGRASTIGGSAGGTSTTE
jgi:hypothetical protein